MTEFLISSTSESSPTTWGAISGTLSNQSDLNAALNAKENVANKVGTITASSTNYPTNNAVINYVTTSNLITSTTRIASGTLISSDVNKLVRMNVATANTLTIPANLFGVGAQILIKQAGAGQTTILPGAGVTLTSFNGRNKLAGQNAICSLIQESTNVWAIEGNLVN